MTTRHFDVIVLGESLAANIAAVLLVKAGKRVLVLCEPPAACVYSFVPSCRHLDRLLDLLDDRSCLTPAPPIQVLTSTSRLTFHGPTSLSDELRREFPTDGVRVESLLARLRAVGEGLESALWESGGLPLTGFGSRWRFAWRRLRHGLTRRILARPLSKLLDGLQSADARQALVTLFTGQALVPPERLSLTEGALLWCSFSASIGARQEALGELLRHRFEQFHGARAELNELESVQATAGRLGGVRFKDGSICTADHFLLGSPTALLHHPELPGTRPTPHAATSQAAGLVVTGGISPLLARTVFLAGSPPLRLTLSSDTGEGRCRIDCHLPSDVPTTDKEGLLLRLAELFPFADLKLESTLLTPLPTPVAPVGPKSFPGSASNLPAGPNLLHCSGTTILPTLGATGEILVGMSVANHLLRRRGT